MKQIVRQLNLYYYGMMTLTLIAAVVSYFLVYKGLVLPLDPMSQLGQVLQYIVIFDALLTIPLGLFLCKKRCDTIRLIEDEAERFAQYKKVAALRIVLVSNAMIWGIAAFYLMGRYQSMLWVAAISAIGWYFTKPTETAPALLTLGEVETFLHEFGHALHGMFSKVRFESLSGTNVYRDFVELPSQFMENYAVEPEFLHTFAFHYQTGEPIPNELIERIRKSRNYNVAYACMRQVSFGLLDMAYYTKEDEFVEDIIQKKYRRKAIAVLHKLVLRELEGDQERLLLPLGTAFSYRMTIQHEEDFIPLDS